MRFCGEIWKKILPYLKKERLLMIFLAGVLLMLLSVPGGFGFSAKKDQNVTQTKELSAWGDMPSEDITLQEGKEPLSVAKEEAADVFLYARELEKELETILGCVEGAGRVKVMITLRESGEKIVEKEMTRVQKQTGERDHTGENKAAQENTLEEKALLDGEGNLFVVKETYPQVEGVVVLAGGVGTGRVRSDLSEAVQALFGIEAHKVKVMKLGHIPSETGIE